MDLFEPDPPIKCTHCQDNHWTKVPGGMVLCRHCSPDTMTPVRAVAERMGLLQPSPGAAPPHPAAPQTLSRCAGEGTSGSAVRVEDDVNIPSAELDPREDQIARLVLLRGPENPIKISEIKTHTNLDERTIKGICRTLRDRFLLPIGASRKAPAGIYWIRTPEAFLSYYDTTKSQAMAELATLGKMCRKHFPELAGQLRLFEDPHPAAPQTLSRPGTGEGISEAR